MLEKAAQENPALASQNFSKEAYVIKRLVTRMKQENDETGARSRYKKLTGRNPAMTETRRLTNGTVDTDALRKNCGTREVRLGNEKKLSGSAQFVVTIKPGKVESTDYLRGDDALQPLSDKLTAAQYPLQFPPNSGTILVLHVDVNCHATTPCVATLINPVPARPQPPVSAY